MRPPNLLDECRVRHDAIAVARERFQDPCSSGVKRTSPPSRRWATRLPRSIETSPSSSMPIGSSPRACRLYDRTNPRQELGALNGFMT